MKHFTRRSWLQLAGLGSLVTGALHWRPGALSAGQSLSKVQHENPHLMGAVGRVSTEAFDPSVFLRTWNFSNLPDTERARFYRETPRSNGTLLREYEMFAVDRDVEIAPGVFFPAWTYNGQVPGPTLRANEGDRIRVNFINQGTHPHTIHFHGWHPPEMDGSMPDHEVAPGERFVYEFDAEPFGVHLYHCHSVPLKRHIHKGLYGAFIIDPPTGAVATRAPADELIMMLNSFDTNFDAENEVYAVNTVAHFHMHEPIRVQVGQLVRMYVINITEFDLLNSLHLHGMFFDVYRTGTQLIPSETTDTVMFCQGERMVLETTFRYPGDFMFHAHQSEFAELGWMGLFRAESDRRET
jgi:FtsP/CotA-like multicopper oxidase with cupredoxin domain